MAIDKYVYIILKDRFDSKIYINYSNKEIVNHVSEIKHELVRESLDLVGISGGIEITSLSDIPSGSGLGSSGSFTVGLLNALYTFIGKQKSSQELIKDATKIEMEILGKPIGLQDQYAAGMGGFNFYTFSGINSTDSKWNGASIYPIDMPPQAMKEFMGSLRLYSLGNQRAASCILSQQKENISQNLLTLDRMRDLACEGYHLLGNYSELHDHLGHLIDESWNLKKTLADNISNAEIDHLYDDIINCGAFMKLTGAGSTGHILVYCPQGTNFQKLDSRLAHLQYIPFDISKTGSKILVNV